MVEPAADEDKPGAEAARARCVVLGASNVARGLGALVAACRAQATCAGPRGPLGPELLVATGRGRSYGTPAGLLGIANPGHVAGPIWRALDSTDGSGALFALVTDVGNDVLYGAPAADIAAWVETCCERLAARGARTVLAGLPLQGLTSLGRREFALWKRVFFPARHLDYEVAQATIVELDQRLRAVAVRSGAVFVEPDPRWYGYDPIHPRLWNLRRAWSAFVGPWTPELEPHAGLARPVSSEALGQALRGLRWNFARPAARTLFSRAWRGEQPVWRDRDGTTLGLY